MDYGLPLSYDYPPQRVTNQRESCLPNSTHPYVSRYSVEFPIVSLEIPSRQLTHSK